ncbi:hypothetical protein E2C01_020762 [Portunus trituberculatus]|uniref:Uncharacterized protein n=1 Tax=Portunus trituberculatus TaxID=210409 RepID=A0A5B7E2G6_PORTR|nr:hypothetical protein [Portunus trituberculatus]
MVQAVLGVYGVDGVPNVAEMSLPHLGLKLVLPLVAVRGSHQGTSKMSVSMCLL